MNNSLYDTVEIDINKFSEDTKDKGISFIFPSIFLGGHEIMAIEIIKKISYQGKVEAGSITCFVPETNIKLIELMNDNSIAYVTFKGNASKPEFLHAFLNPIYILRCSKVFNTIPKKNKVILVQGDILQGVGFIISSKLLSRELISYIPYSHSFNKMNAKSARLKDIFAKITYQMCNSFITISECFKRDIEIKNNNANVSLIHNFVKSSPDKFKSRQLNLDDDVNIFIIGRVQFHQKGHDILVNALAGITKYKIALHIIGDGPDMNSLETMKDKLPSNVSLVFHGWVSDSWRIARDRNIDLLVIPSLFEGVPLVMLEAMERNVPIIAAARDGMLDYLPADCLYEVTGDDATALRDKIVYFIQKRLAEI
jgi:glycosyltransferase involved in cell wall biosynthesis